MPSANHRIAAAGIVTGLWRVVTQSASLVRPEKERSLHQHRPSCRLSFVDKSYASYDKNDLLFGLGLLLDVMDNLVTCCC